MPCPNSIQLRPGSISLLSPLIQIRYMDTCYISCLDATAFTVALSSNIQHHYLKRSLPRSVLANREIKPVLELCKLCKSISKAG